MDKYCLTEDCKIERGRPDQAVDLCDAEGVLLFRFPPGWTDEQVKSAIAFANKAYVDGIAIGKARKAIEIKTCLEIG